METKIYKITTENISSEGAIRDLNETGDIIKRGGLVAFPTETVYGLGGDALNKESSRKIYAAKGRPSDNPLIVHVAKKEDIYKITQNVSESAKRLIKAFMPGPITLVMEKNDLVPYETTGGLDTVAVRMPSHKVASCFIESAGGFVAAPSANISGRPSPTCASHVADDLTGIIEAVIDDGSSVIGLESTIVDTTVDPVMILRPGYITRDDIKEILGECELDPTITGASQSLGLRPKAPGMKYKHYAPKACLEIVNGDNDKVRKLILENALMSSYEGKKTAIIGVSENKDFYLHGISTRSDDQGDQETIGDGKDNVSALKDGLKENREGNVLTEKSDMMDSGGAGIIFKEIGSRCDGLCISENLYRILRELDDEDIETAYSEAYYDVTRSENDSENIGFAIMNRLIKAAAHNIVDIS